MKISKNSLQARIKNYSKEKSVPANSVLQEFFFEAFIKRLCSTKYINNFIFKGGFLLSINLGIDFRSTMDMDFLLKNIQFERENIINIINEVIKQDIDDNITFEFININNIREEDIYGGFRISLLGRFENIKVPVSIDVATGDPITPSAVIYKYKCLFDCETLSFSAYNYETILAEKLQTIINRGTANSRSKDFYDIYIIYKLRKEEINFENLKLAFKNTCEHRDTHFDRDYSEEIITTIAKDQNINIRWLSYARKNAFASKINFKEIIEILYNLINYVY